MCMFDKPQFDYNRYFSDCLDRLATERELTSSLVKSCYCVDMSDGVTCRWQETWRYCGSTSTKRQVNSGLWRMTRSRTASILDGWSREARTAASLPPTSPVTSVNTGTQSYCKLGAIHAFFWIFDTYPPPRNANSIDPYIFFMLFSKKSDSLPPPAVFRNTWIALYAVSCIFYLT